MLETITFLATNKVAIIGACGVIAEIVIIVVNTIRRCKASKQSFELMSNKTGFQKFLWAANPINLFRKV